MDQNTEETTSLSLLFKTSVDDRGGGGKLKKPSTRSRPLATPYSRPPPPPQSQPEIGRGRWLLSKVVGGATKIVSSFFSKSSSLDYSSDDQEEEFNDQLHANEKSAVDLEASRLIKVAAAAGPSRMVGGSDFDGQNQREKDHGISEIEHLVKNKTFSRDDIDRLLEIIRARAANVPGVDLEKKDMSASAGKDAKPKVAFEIPRKSLDEKQDDTNRVVWGSSTKVLQSAPKIALENARSPFEEKQEDLNKGFWGTSTPMLKLAPKVAFDSPRKLLEEKEEDLSKAMWGTSTPILQSAIGDKVGASPIEIARAYMGARRSEMSLGPKNMVFKGESASQLGDESVSKPFIPSPSSKPTTCWPGAMVQDHQDYTTPRSQRGRFGCHNFPRTPYSRSIYAKSKSKLTPLQGDSSVGPNNSFTALLKSRTPIFGQSRSNPLDDVQGSVGPIRRIQHKANAETPFRGSVYSHSSLKSLSHVDNSNVSERFFPAAEKNLEPGGTSSSSLMFQSVDDKPQSSEGHVPTSHPHSIQMARTILEHLERNPPTPKDKSAELKLAISWEKPQSSDVKTVMPNEHNSLPLLGVDSGKMDLGAKKVSAHLNEDIGDSIFKFPPPRNLIVANGSVNKATLAADSRVGGGTSAIHGGNAGSLPDFRETQNSQLKSANKDVTKVISNATSPELPSAPKLKQASPHVSGNKPILPSITIGKPVQNWTFSSDNSSGFTFPVSTSCSVFSEPPTPTIMPLSANSGLHPSKEGPTVPTFSFGSKSSTPPLVFSFPSTSSTPIHNDASDIKFSFGSDKTTRVSFSSIGKDAICY